MERERVGQRDKEEGYRGMTERQNKSRREVKNEMDIERRR
jgi:hypothetical protein